MIRINIPAPSASWGVSRIASMFRVYSAELLRRQTLERSRHLVMARQEALFEHLYSRPAPPVRYVTPVAFSDEFSDT